MGGCICCPTSKVHSRVVVEVIEGTDDEGGVSTPLLLRLQRQREQEFRKMDSSTPLPISPPLSSSPPSETPSLPPSPPFPPSGESFSPSSFLQTSPNPTPRTSTEFSERGRRGEEEEEEEEGPFPTQSSLIPPSHFSQDHLLLGQYKILSALSTRGVFLAMSNKSKNYNYSSQYSGALKRKSKSMRQYSSSTSLSLSPPCTPPPSFASSPVYPSSPSSSSSSSVLNSTSQSARHLKDMMKEEREKEEREKREEEEEEEERDEFIVIKMVEKERFLGQISKSRLLSIVSEMSRNQELQHPNILKTLSCRRHRESLYLFLEYFQRSSPIIDFFQKEALSIQTLLSISKQILEALVYLRENGISHRCLVGRNVLINTQGIIKLSNIQLAPIKYRTREEATTSYLKQWLPPEVKFSLQQFTHQSDIYMFGCTLIELLVSTPLYLSRKWRILSSSLNCSLGENGEMNGNGNGNEKEEERQRLRESFEGTQGGEMNGSSLFSWFWWGSGDDLENYKDEEEQLLNGKEEPKEKRKKQKRKEINVAFEEILPYIQEKHSFLDRNFLQQFLGKVVTICLISDPAHRPSACDVLKVIEESFH